MPDSPTKDVAQIDSIQKNSEEITLESENAVNPENDEFTQEEQSVTRANGEDVEQLPEESTNANETTVVRRRYKKINRPLYYIGGNNGTHIVDEFLSSLGWERISDKTRDDYKLKWCEIKSHNNYYSFKEGEQLCYQIPNNKVLTTKIGLLTSLQEYDRVMNKVKKGKPRIMKYQDFFPETYRMDVREERELFCEIYKENEIWISKPTGLNQGKGIYLIRSRDEINKLQEKMADIEEEVQATRKLPFKIPMARIVQRYITNPLLLDGKKFDVRNYMLISSTQPYVVFYRDGYCRLTCLPYDERSTDMTGHLTNQFMQKKNPLYQEVKDETVWSMDRFNEYVNKNHMERNKLPQDWVHTVLRKRCQQVMHHCFQSVRHKLENKLGFFDLYGCDFLVDDNFKISLLEFNCNPALHTNCELLKEVIPEVVVESLQLALEVFNKSKAKERIMPLASQRDAVLLYNGDVIEAEERREKLRSAAEVRKRARSAQRRKKFMANFNVRYALQTRRGSDGEAEPNGNDSIPNNNTSNQANHTTKLSPKQSQSCESLRNAIGTSPSIYHPSGSRSQTSFSNSATLAHSPPRVAQSRSMPNVTSQKKPFYAGGSVPSRPFSAPRFQRAKNNDSRKSLPTTTKNNATTSTDATGEDAITEESVAASLNAKLKVYKTRVPGNNETEKRDAGDNSTEKQDKGKEKTMKEERKEKDTADSKQQIRGRPRERYIVKKTTDDRERYATRNRRGDSSPDSDEEENEKILSANKKLLEAMSSSVAAMQAPSAKLPLNYHNKMIVDNEFSKKYLAGIAAAKKGQNKTGMKVFKTPLPSALTLQARESANYYLSTNEQQLKVQYRAPTTVRVRQTLQATTCTLEIGPKSRRGLVAIPTTASATPLVQTQRPLGSKNGCSGNNAGVATKLRMMNAPASLVTSPSLEIEEPGSLPGVRICLDDPQLQLQSSAAVLSGDVNELKQQKSTCVDSSTQTPVSNSTLSSEEKVIWRLRTRIGATSNNVRQPNRSLIPSKDMVVKSTTSSSFPSTFSGIRMSNNPLSPRYVAVRPTPGNGVTLAISPPALIAGKNMLPTILEGKNINDINNSFNISNESSPRLSDPRNTPSLSQQSQTIFSDLDYELPSGATVRTILDGVARAKFEDSPERWMAPG